jgi:hypothetical protein
MRRSLTRRRLSSASVALLIAGILVAIQRTLDSYIEDDLASLIFTMALAILVTSFLYPALKSLWSNDPTRRR